MTQAEPQVLAKEHQDDKDHGPQYFVDIEGVIHPWPRNTITFQRIRRASQR